MCQQSYLHKAGVAILLAIFFATETLGRQWTDKNGRTIEAQLLRVNGASIELRLPDGKNRTYRVEDFSEEDQRFIKSITDLPGRSVRTWTIAIEESTFRATFVMLDGDDVTLKRTDGTWKTVPLGILSVADKRYVEAVTKAVGAPILFEPFALLDEKNPGKMPEEVEELVRTYRDEDNKARVTRIEALRSIAEALKTANDANTVLPFLRQVILEGDLESRVLVFNEFAEIGAPSVPTLISVLQAMKEPTTFMADKEDEGHVWEYRQIVRRYDLVLDHWIPGNPSLTSLAISSLAEIGEDAREATPILLDLCVLSDRRLAHYLGQADGVGSDVTWYCQAALAALGRIKPDTAAISPALAKLMEANTQCLEQARQRQLVERQRQQNSHVYDNAKRELVPQCNTVLEMLQHMSPPPKELVRPLMRLIEHDCAQPVVYPFLGRIGPDAKDALPLLRSKLEDPAVGRLAEGAIAKING